MMSSLEDSHQIVCGLIFEDSSLIVFYVVCACMGGEDGGSGSIFSSLLRFEEIFCIMVTRFVDIAHLFSLTCLLI